MRIKNTDELVARANGHARLDHITQGTYGEASANGEVEFRGCLIGCWATPHGFDELLAWVREHTRKSGSSTTVRSGAIAYTDNATKMVERLGEQFGIVPELARVAEHYFESMPTHGSAIEFLPMVAEALVEGSEITAADVAEWYPGVVNDLEAWCADDGEDPTPEAFLDWLRSRPVVTETAAA